MTAQDVASALGYGTLVGLALVGLYVIVDALLFPNGSRHSLAQLVTNVWHTRPRRDLSRTRRTRTQGPDN